jgi:hypothetical protein
VLTLWWIAIALLAVRGVRSSRRGRAHRPRLLEALELRDQVRLLEARARMFQARIDAEGCVYWYTLPDGTIIDSVTLPDNQHLAKFRDQHEETT